MNTKSVPVFSTDEIDRVFFLSAKEWKAAKEIETVPLLTGAWWLRSSGAYYKSTCYVLDGIIDGHFSQRVAYKGVRPAFGLPGLLSSNCPVGDKIIVGNKTVCTVISKDVALADTSVCRHVFDSEENEWNNSEIREYVNSDEFKKLL